MSAKGLTFFEMDDIHAFGDGYSLWFNFPEDCPTNHPRPCFTIAYDILNKLVYKNMNEF